jgi:hypothetical protein
MRANPEELVATASYDDIFITELSLNHAAINYLSARNSIAEIQSCRVFHIRDPRRGSKNLIISLKDANCRLVFYNCRN